MPGGRRVSNRARAETRGVAKSRLISKHKDASFLNKHYEVVRVLGSGSFGTVSLVIDRRNRQERVNKVVNIKGMSRMVIEQMKREIELLASLDHPSIVKLFEYAEDTRKCEIAMILEYIPGGSMLDVLQEKGNALSESTTARVMYQLLVALCYCHQRGVAHRDIKPENLMAIYPPGGREPNVKLIDFGLAHRRCDSPIAKSPASAAASRGRFMTINPANPLELQDDDSWMIDGYCGTPKYMPPELHRKVNYTVKADIWSVGISTMELLTGTAPFQKPYEKTVVAFKRSQGLRPLLRGDARKRWDDLSDDVQDFMEELLEPDFTSRPSARDAMDHNWLEEHRPKPQKLTRNMTKSFVGFAGAPPYIRCCLLSIAARMGDANIESLGAAFLGADADGDGMIDGDDLRKALKDMDERTWFWDSARKVDVDRMMLVADLDHSGGLSFTEFVGACLYQSRADRGALPEEAFSALDDDRDGLVSVNDIRGLFRERDASFLDQLPEGRPFNVEEWIDVIENCSEYTDSVASSDGAPSGGIFDLLSLKCCDSSVQVDEDPDEDGYRYVSSEPM